MKLSRQTRDRLRAAEALRRSPPAPSDHNFAPDWLSGGTVVRWLGWRHRRTVTLIEPEADYGALSREHIARYPKIRARLAE